MMKQIFYKEYFYNNNGPKKRNRTNLGEKRPKRGEGNTHLKNKKISKKIYYQGKNTKLIIFYYIYMFT